MRIAIFGVGAMGCLFGARLSPHAEVTLIGRWPEQLAALADSPLEIRPPDADPEHVRLSAVRYAEDAAPADLALVLTKAARTESVAHDLPDVLAPGGIAITLQNGVGNDAILARLIGEDRVIQGTTTQGAATRGPGLLIPGGPGVTHLATRPAVDAQVRQAAALFEQAGFATEVLADVSGIIWSKLAVNAAINPLTALLRVPNGVLLESGWAREIMDAAARETAAVAAALGIQPPPGHWSQADPARRAEEVARLTALNRSSMLQDVLRGAPTEIETICGAIMREGERLAVPTPANTMLYRLVKALEETTPHRL